MIFWWSESKLERFIVKCLEQEHIREEICNLNGEITSITNKVSVNKKHIQGLEKDFDEHRKETSEAVEKLKLSVLSVSKAKENNIDAEGIATKIKNDCIQYVNKAITENNKNEIETIVRRYIQSMDNSAQTNKVLLEHENQLKRLSAEIEKTTNEEILNSLIKGYEEQKRKNIELSEIVRKQSEGIAGLSKTIEELQKQIEKLREKNTLTNEEIKIPTVRKTLIFDDDNNANKCKLLSLSDNAKELKRQLCEMGLETTDVYQKLVDNLVDKLDKFIVKNSEKQYAADKVAFEVVKILRQTIVKGLMQEKVKVVFTQYMDKCGIRKLDWNIGKRLSNDDYEYLEEPIIYEEVTDALKAGTILGIMQDTYVIDYLDDDEKYEAIIPGLYKIGKR